MCKVNCCGVDMKYSSRQREITHNKIINYYFLSDKLFMDDRISGNDITKLNNVITRLE